jgi:hypothetical protein
MNSSDPNPALPTWIFIATDIVLICTAGGIAMMSPQPLTTGRLLAVVALVGIGAIAGLVPLVVRYERQKNAALDERQQALEALARTVSSSAEQISIAASGFHTIVELAHKNLRMAEQLPHKLQEKMAEFQSQLSVAEDADKEELERELLALRTSESERLESVSQRIAKSSAEWAKLEATTNQHLIAANEAVSKLAFGTASAIGKAQAAAEQALSQARVEAARALGEVSGKATRTIESAKSSALIEFDARIASATATLVERVAAEFRLRTGVSTAAAADASAASHPANSTVGNESAAAELPAVPAPSVASVPASETSVAQPPKRPRKMRRDDAAANAAPEETAATAESSVTPAATPAPVAAENVSTLSDEPLPVPAGTIPEIAPVAPNTAEPFSGHIASITNGSAPPIAPEPSPAADVPAPADGLKAPRKRTTRKPDSETEPGLGLELDDTPASSTSGMAERVLTSDGATRLLVTAYIGIGNRLYIRGNGPGLSWEKGVPLQFVSIGKWRWETNDANAPVQFKLYKNDDLECAALGSQSLDPGHQQEVTAAF